MQEFAWFYAIPEAVRNILESLYLVSSIIYLQIKDVAVETLNTHVYTYYR